MIDKKQTAVEWLVSQLSLEHYDDTVSQALAMEKEQIAKSIEWCLSGVMHEESALNEGYKYYRKTYEK